MMRKCSGETKQKEYDAKYRAKQRAKNKNKIVSPYMKKRCVCCGEDKFASEFEKNLGKPDGLNSYCKVCARQLRLRRHKELREKLVTLFGAKCYLCGRTCKDKDGTNFSFHEIHGKKHDESMWYVDKHKEDFRLLCKKCHRFVHRLFNNLKVALQQKIREIDCSDWKSLNAFLGLDFTPDYLTAWKVAENFQKKVLGLLVEQGEK